MPDIQHPMLRIVNDLVGGSVKRTRNGCEYLFCRSRRNGQAWLVFGFNHPERLLLRKANKEKHSRDFIQYDDPYQCAKALGVTEIHDIPQESIHAALLSQPAFQKPSGAKQELVHYLARWRRILQRPLA